GSNVPPAPPGTKCTDPPCPQANPTCDGNGKCGNRNICNPVPSGPGACTYVNTYNKAYWLCPPVATSPDGGTPSGGLTEPQAQAACSAKGLTLLRLDSLDDQRYIVKFLSRPIWLGANQITTAGQWRWSAPNTNNGDIFWNGGPTGSPN